VNSSYLLQKITRPTFASSSLYSDLSLRWPNNYVKDPNGYYSNFSEILKLLEGGKHDEDRDLYSTTASLNIEPVKDWIANISISQINMYGKYEEADIPVWEHGVDLTPVNVQGVSSYTRQQSKSANTTASAYSTYQKQLGNHYFKAMAGWQYEYYKYGRVNGRRQGLISNSVTSFISASGDQFVADDQYEWALNSFFGRLNYNYQEKYLLEINARADGSSRFPEESRWGFFPSISAGYVMSRENYWDNLKNIVNFFKIRASYGALGNQSVSIGSGTNGIYYPYTPTMPITLNSYWIFPDNSQIYVSAPGLIAQDLTWETVRGGNLGLNASTLKNRLSIDVDVYRRITDNMFGPVASLPAILGTSAPRANNATLETIGYEILVSWRDQIGKFNYNVSASLADYTGKIIKYNNPTMLNTTYYEGAALGEIWGYVTEGLFQTPEEVSSSADQSKINAQLWKPGDVKYKDLNGDNKIDYGNNTVMDPGDRTVIGNNTPRYSYSFTFSGSYKNFDFNMFWQGIGKRDLWVSNSLFWGMYGGQWSSGGFEPHTDYWTENNRDAYFPRPLWNTSGKNQQTQSRYLLDASYLRVKSLQLGYTIPTCGDFIKKCRIYLAGENLLTFTKMFKNFDPEIENNGLSYPLQKALSIGCNISF
jgi:TonB-linked SusC/RagA family outer membrane protein